MYFISKILPFVKEHESPDYKGGFLNINNKKRVIKNFEEKKKKGIEIPLCLDHANGNEEGFGFVVPKDKRIGKVNEIIINKNGDLIASCEVYVKDMLPYVHDMLCKKEKLWGVSVWIDFNIMDPNSKDITHVALTQEPGFGEYDSYIYEFSSKKDVIDSLLREKHFDLTHGFCSDELLEKWKKEGFKLIILKINTI